MINPDDVTIMVDKSNFDNKQYKADLQCAYDCDYVKGQVDILEKIKADFEEIKGLRDNPYNNKTEYSVSMEELRKLFDEHITELKGKNKLTCDRNICLKNEYSNIGCEDCVVTKGE